jgi:hypothetical protein
MSLTIDEAIARFEANAEQNERWASGGLNPEANVEYAAEHRQLAEWLRELQERRKEPEIIRCGECRHNGTHNCLLNLWATIFNSKPKDDFYCGMAERRTDD